MRPVCRSWLLFAAAVVTLVPTLASAEFFIDFGAALTNVDSKIAAAGGAVDSSDSDTGLHLGLGARKPINDRSDIGVRLELDSLNSDQLLAIRAFDYRRHRSDNIALNYFFGAARLSRGTPAFGYYLGFGVQFRQALADFDVGIDLRYGDKIARDNLLPTDFQGGSPDNFFDITGISLYLSHRF